MNNEEYTRMYLEEISMIPPLSEDELSELPGKLPDAAAAERLINGSLAYVAGQASAYVQKHVDASDLIQEGNMAVMLLVRNYSGGSFEELRKKTVQIAMESYRDSQNQNDHLEEEVTAYVNVLNRVTTELAKELGREATLSEVAEKMKLSEDQVRILMKEAVNAVSADEQNSRMAQKDEDDAGDKSER